MALPIWKDYFITLFGGAAGKPVDFSVYCKDSPIYTGRAFPRPGSNYPSIRVNEICADYLTRALPIVGNDYYGAEFRVTYNGLSSAFTMARDWSYESTFTPGTDAPMFPVVPILHPGQYLPIWAPEGAYTATLILRPASPGDFCNDFNDDFLYFGATSIVVTKSDLEGDFQFLDLSAYSNLAAVQVNGITYQVADLCGGYVLYYINAYGGWDSIPVQGRTIRTDTITRYNREDVYSNGFYYNRGKENYVNEVEEKFKFVIGPLTTEQSARMPHLLGSTFVYLHDIDKGRIHPLNLTAATIEHKTRPGALHFYEVEASLGQNRTRR